MPTNLGSIYTSIELNLTKLKDGVNKAIGLVHGFATAVDKESARVDRTTGQLSVRWAVGFALMSGAVYKATHKVNSAFNSMLSTFAGFQQSLANTQSVARASAEDLALMEEAARRVGATTRSTSAEAANALYYLASAGFTAAESIAALDGVNALAIATQSDLAKTSETIATVIRQYNLETSKATDIANIFTAAITNSLATMNKLAKSFEYVGPIAAGLGLTVEETTGALQLLYNKGFSGEKAGRALRSILVDLADSTSIVNKRLSRLGLTFDEINPATNKLGDIFDRLRERGVDASNAAAIFGKVSGVQLAALISKASTAKGGINELTAAVTGTNRAFEAMEIQMDTLQGSIDEFKNAEEALQISTGKGLEPVLRTIIDAARNLLLILNNIPSSILAFAAAMAVAVSTTTALSLGLTTVKLTLQAMGLAAAKAIPSLAALLGIGSTLSAGFVGAVGAMAAATAYYKNVNKKYFEEARNDFGALADELGITEEKFEDFIYTAKQVGLKASRLSKDTVADAYRLKEALAEIAAEQGIGIAQALEMAKANDAFVQKAGISLSILEGMLATEKELAKVRQSEYIKDLERLTGKERANARQAKMLEEQQEDILENERNTQEAYNSLEKAFMQSAEWQKLLGNEYDRNKALLDAYNRSLGILIEQGLGAESKEVRELTALYKVLQKEYGAVTTAKTKMSDTEIRAEVESELTKQLALIEEKEKVSLAFQQEYNAEQERSKVVLAAITKLLENNFTFEGKGLQKIIALYGHLIQSDVAKVEKVDEYKKKLEDLHKTERQIALENAGNDAEKIANVNKYFDAIEEKANIDRNVQVTSDYQDKLEEVGKTELELIEINRARTLETVVGFEEATVAVNKYYDAIAAQEKTRVFVDNVKNVLNFISTLSSGISGVVTDTYQRAIDEEKELLEEALKLLDTQEQAELEAAGLAEETEGERLANELAALQAAYDAEVDLAAKAALELQLIDKQKEVDKYNIEEKYRLLREQAEEESAKKAAKLQYKMALSTWKNNLNQTITSGALAVMETFKNFGGWPFGVIPAGIMGGLVTAQTNSILKSKPEEPKFNNGGIVPGSSYKGDTVPILANSGELILNKAQQNNLASQLSSVPIEITVVSQTTLDGKLIAENSAKYYKNGQVQL